MRLLSIRCGKKIAKPDQNLTSMVPQNGLALFGSVFCHCVLCCIEHLDAFVQTLCINERRNNTTSITGFAYRILSSLPWFVIAVSTHFAEKSAMKVFSKKPIFSIAFVLVCRRHLLRKHSAPELAYTCRHMIYGTALFN